MKKSIITVLALCSAAGVMADVFGTGANEFALTFQGISSGSNPSSGYGQVGYNYSIGTHEVTADQWSKYAAASGGPAGGSTAPTTTGSLAVNNASWNEAAQFVNWLNTSSGHQAAYSFDGSGNMSLWGDDDKSATSAFRHKNAVYVLPSEDEWVKAAYWNGSSLQTYSTPGDTLTGMDVNYGGSSIRNVGIGSEEINGTFDMMGNVWEWNESAFAAPDDSTTEDRVIRGGSYVSPESYLHSSSRFNINPTNDYNSLGFRVAAIPEPSSIALIGLAGGFVLGIRRMFIM